MEPRSSRVDSKDTDPRSTVKKRLDMFRVKMANDHVDYSDIESLLFNVSYNHCIYAGGEKGEFYEDYIQLYKTAIRYVSDEIRYIDQHAFVSIPKEELETLDKAADQKKTPFRYRYTQNCEGLVAYVTYDILKYEDVALCIMAYERWALIMSRLVGLYDYTALNIYSVLATNLNKFLPFASQTTHKLMKKMDRIFDAGQNKMECLRDLYMSKAIPLIANYSGFISASQESFTDKTEKDQASSALNLAAAEHVAVEKKDLAVVPRKLTPDQKVVTTKTVSAIQHLQEENARLMDINYVKAKHVNGFTDPIIFADPNVLNEKIKELAKRIFGINEDLTDLNEVKHKLVEHRKKALLANSKSLLQEVRDVIISACAPSVSKSHIEYHEQIYSLREYSRSKASDDDSAARHKRLKEFLSELSFESRILQKIELIQIKIAEHDELIRLKQPGLFTSLAKKALQRLIDILMKRQVEDMNLIAKINVDKTMSGKNSPATIYAPPFLQDASCHVRYNHPRLNLTNSKAAFTVSVKPRGVNFDGLEANDKSVMSWVNASQEPGSTRNLSDSSSEEDRRRSDDSNETSSHIGAITNLSGSSSANGSPKSSKRSHGTPYSDGKRAPTSGSSSPGISRNSSGGVPSLAVPSLKRIPSGGASSPTHNPILKKTSSSGGSPSASPIARLALERRATGGTSGAGEKGTTEISSPLESPSSSEPSPTSKASLSKIPTSGQSSPTAKGNVPATRSDTVMPILGQRILPRSSVEGTENLAISRPIMPKISSSEKDAAELSSPARDAPSIPSHVSGTDMPATPLLEPINPVVPLSAPVSSAPEVIAAVSASTSGSGKGFKVDTEERKRRLSSAGSLQAFANRDAVVQAEAPSPKLTASLNGFFSKNLTVKYTVDTKRRDSVSSDSSSSNAKSEKGESKSEILRPSPSGGKS